MADIDPGVGEQVLHLELKHLVVDIDVAMHLGVADQTFDGIRIATITVHHCLLSSYKSSTRRGVFARDTQICISLPDAFSLSDRMKSRWSGVPSITPTWQIPQSPRLQS